ncbi:MAG: LPXTG cell wall anchor domain-containing protein [Cellvibrionaceae bacterium]
MKIVTLILLILLSTLSMAHSGHSEGNAMLHEAEHTMWILSGAALLLAVAGFWVLKKR